MSGTVLLAWSVQTVWTEGRPELKDHWAVYEDLKDAEAQYKKLLELPHLYSASICGVIKSTDYKNFFIVRETNEHRRTNQ